MRKIVLAAFYLIFVRKIKLTPSDIDRLSADLKLTPNMKPVFDLLRFDPETDFRELRRVFDIPGEDTGHPSIPSTETQSETEVQSQSQRQSSIKLDLTNDDGNTVLHCITLAMKKDSQDKDTYMKLFDAITSSAYAWACQFKQFRLPKDDNIKLIYKRNAVRHLTTEIRNSDGLSVLELAFKTGATKVVEKLLMMEGVTCTPQDATGLQKFDVGHIIPSTQYSSEKKVSCLERLLLDPLNITSEIFDLPPVKAIENSYSNVLTVLYLLITAIHIVYMTIISYASIAYLEEIKRTNDSILRNVSGYQSIVTIIGPSEPIVLFIIAGCYSWPLKRTCLGNSTQKGILNTCMSCVSKNLLVVLMLPFFCLVLALIVHIAEERNTSALYYLTSITLLYGWLMTLAFAYGMKIVHFFLQIIWQMILQNMRQIILVYAFFLLAFSLAIHAQFLASDDAITTYKSPIHTMFLLFNIMMGIGEMFDDKGKLELGLEEGGVRPLFTKLLYIAYIIFVTVILLNLLIAMMNKSYSRIRHHHPLSWRVKTMQLGIKIDLTAPLFCTCFHKHGILYGPMFDDTPTDRNWYVVVKHDQENSRRKERTLDEMEEAIMERMQTADAKMNHVTESFEAKLDFLIEILAKAKSIDTADGHDEIKVTSAAVRSEATVSMDTGRVREAWTES